MAKEEPDYKHIKAAEHKIKRNTKYIDTLSISHSEAYNLAAREHLMDKDSLIDMSRLKQTEYQSKFADSMVKHYISKAKKEFKSESSDEIHDELLLKAYAGITSDRLKKIISSRKDNFTKSFFESQLAPQMVNTIENDISDLPYKGLKEEHKKDVVSYIDSLSNNKISHMIDTSKMSLEDAVGLLELTVKKGGVLESDIEGTPYHLKKEKKK